MQAPTASLGDALPHQESKRIIEDLFPHRGSIHDVQDTDQAIQGTSNGNDGVISGAVTDGNLGSQTLQRDSDDTLREDKRGINAPREESIGYHGSSDTIGDEEKQHIKAKRHTFLDLDSNSILRDDEKQGRGSRGASFDLENGDAGSNEHNELDQDRGDERHGQWENNVVGWDGPNDPQNPMNWKKTKKYTVTTFFASLTFCITFASSAFSTATMVTAKMYGVSNEVMTLGTSLFVLASPHTQQICTQH